MTEIEFINKRSLSCLGHPILISLIETSGATEATWAWTPIARKKTTRIDWGQVIRLLTKRTKLQKKRK